MHIWWQRIYDIIEELIKSSLEATWFKHEIYNAFAVKYWFYDFKVKWIKKLHHLLNVGSHILKEANWFQTDSIPDCVITMKNKVN